MSNAQGGGGTLHLINPLCELIIKHVRGRVVSTFKDGLHDWVVQPEYDTEWENNYPEQVSSPYANWSEI